MYYENNSASDQSNKTAVWSNNYRGVWHSAESSGNAADSTSYGTDGTLSGGVTQGTAGQIGTAYDYDAVDGNVNITDPGDGHLDFGTGSFTVGVWANVDQSLGTWQMPLYKGGGSAANAGYMHEVHNTNPDWIFYISDGTTNVSADAATITYGNWEYYVGVVNRTSDTIHLYKDGVEVGTANDISAIGSVDTDKALEFSRVAYIYDGKLDEIHISNTARTADWILTDYNTQSDAAGSITVGPEINTPYPYIVSGSLAADNSYVDVAFSEAVYNTGGGSGALESSDFDITFAANGGTATGATITGVTKMDGNPLVGGETVVRVNLSITGTPNGLETVEIKPVDGISIYDADGYTSSVTDTTGALTLNVEAPWYDSNWGYRIMITLDGSKVTGNLTNFPYLVYIASNASLSANARSDVGFEGFDILFTSNDGTTKLDHEIEKYITGTGELVSWVEIPSMSAGVDTIIYMYYGYPSAADQSNAAGVWDSNYKGVLHLKETAGAQADSTTNSNNGTASVTTQGSSTGIANGADELSGTADYIQMGTTNWNVNQGTVSLWAYANSFPAGLGGYLFGHTTDPAYANRLQLYTDDANGNLDLGLGDSHSKALNIYDFNITTWYQVTLTWDGTNYEVYVDGISSASGTYTGLTALNTIADIGNTGNTAARNESFNGIIDEVRVSDIVRPIDWIQTSYNVQSDAAGSSSVGPPVERSLTIDSGAVASDNSYVDVTFSEGVYTDTSSNPVVTGDFDYEFAANGGTATGITIDSVTNTSGGALTGGETTVRVHITITGVVSGVETLRIKPFDGASIYNSVDTAMEATQQTGLITLNAVAWYNDGWAHRQKITIDNTKVSGAGSLTNFPMLITIASDANLASAARADGFDILFTSDDGTTKLDHEIELYVTATGELVAWVEIPSLSATVDTDIYMYYLNPSAADQSNATGVWDSDYKAVYHLNEAVTDNSSAAGVHEDSTLNNNDGDQYNNSPVPGKIADAQDFEGDVRDEYIEIPNSATLEDILEDDYTIEVWVNTDQIPPGVLDSDFNAYYGILIKEGMHAGMSIYKSGVVYAQHVLDGDVYEQAPSAVKSASTWYHIAGVVSKTSGFTKIWVDAVNEGTSNWTAGSLAREYGTTPFRIGIGFPGRTDWSWPADAKIDELRISNTVRTDDHIITSYNTQSDSAGTLTFSSEMTTPNPFIDNATLAADNSYVEITFSEV
jgi:hypothetical protein